MKSVLGEKNHGVCSFVMRHDISLAVPIVQLLVAIPQVVMEHRSQTCSITPDRVVVPQYEVPRQFHYSWPLSSSDDRGAFFPFSVVVYVWSASPKSARSATMVASIVVLVYVVLEPFVLLPCSSKRVQVSLELA